MYVYSYNSYVYDIIPVYVQVVYTSSCGGGGDDDDKLSGGSH